MPKSECCKYVHPSCQVGKQFTQCIEACLAKLHPHNKMQATAWAKANLPLRGGRNSMFKLWMLARRLFAMKSKSPSNFRHFMTVGLQCVRDSLLLMAVRVYDGLKLEVMDPKEYQRDVEQEE